MTITASALRNNIYRLLDGVATSGKPLFVDRKGRLLKIVCHTKRDKLAQLPKHDCINCDPEELVHIDWSGEWNNDLP